MLDLFCACFVEEQDLETDVQVSARQPESHAKPGYPGQGGFVRCEDRTLDYRCRFVEPLFGRTGFSTVRNYM